MDWTFAIEQQREAMAVVVAGLIAMAGMAGAVRSVIPGPVPGIYRPPREGFHGVFPG